MLPSLISGNLTRRLGDLPAQTRLLLLVAAADPTGDPTLIWQAAARLRIPREAAFPAMEAHLVTFGGRVVFQDPLVRSTAYHSAPLRDRRAAHDALAQATHPQTAPDRRAWHRSHAGWEPDEEIAAELERTAARAQARGDLVRGQVAYAAGRDGDAPRLLLDAARRLERFDASQARVAYLDAIADATGGRLFPYDALGLAALGGRHDAALELIDGARRDAVLRGGDGGGW